MDASTTTNNSSPRMMMEDDANMSEQPMNVFSLDDRRCPCLLCSQGSPLILQKESVAWTSIIRVAFYVLHTIYPDLPYLSMKTHVSPYILRHWQALGIDKKGDNVKWKKHILDAIWHGDSFFESGTPVLKQTGVWRLINPKADPWLDSPTSSPVPRRKSLVPKKIRSSPAFSIEDLPQQEFATSEPLSPTAATRNLSSSTPNLPPQALPHISHLLRHVDDYWNSRAVHKSPPVHRRATNMQYSPYRSPPLESRFAPSSPPTTPSSPMVSPTSVPTVNLIPVMNAVPTTQNVPSSPTAMDLSRVTNMSPIPPTAMDLSRANMSPLPPSPTPPPRNLSPLPLSPLSPSIRMASPQISSAMDLSRVTNVSPVPPTAMDISRANMSPLPPSPTPPPRRMSSLPPSPVPLSRAQALPQMQPFAPSSLPLLDSPFATSVAPQPCATDVMWMQASAPTRALHMLPCVSSLFQPTPHLPSIFPTS